VLGFARVIRSSDRCAYEGVGDYTIYLARDARGRGVGRALLAAVEERARARGCCTITLEVLEGNTRARALYASCGLVDAGTGESKSTRFLAKPLGPSAEVSA